MGRACEQLCQILFGGHVLKKIVVFVPRRSRATQKVLRKYQLLSKRVHYWPQLCFPQNHPDVHASWCSTTDPGGHTQITPDPEGFMVSLILTTILQKRLTYKLPQFVKETDEKQSQSDLPREGYAAEKCR